MHAPRNCAALHVVKVVVTSSSDALKRSIGGLLGRSAAVDSVPGMETWRRIEDTVLRAVRFADCGDGQVRSGRGADDSGTGVITSDQVFLSD